MILDRSLVVGEGLIANAEVLKALRLASQVADLAKDRQRLLIILDRSLVVGEEIVASAEVVQASRLASPIADLRW